MTSVARALQQSAARSTKTCRKLVAKGWRANAAARARSLQAADADARGHRQASCGGRGALAPASSGLRGLVAGRSPALFALLDRVKSGRPGPRSRALLRRRAASRSPGEGSGRQPDHLRDHRAQRDLMAVDEVDLALDPVLPLSAGRGANAFDGMRSPFLRLRRSWCRRLGGAGGRKGFLRGDVGPLAVADRRPCGRATPAAEIGVELLPAIDWPPLKTTRQ